MYCDWRYNCCAIHWQKCSWQHGTCTCCIFKVIPHVILLFYGQIKMLKIVGWLFFKILIGVQTPSPQSINIKIFIRHRSFDASPKPLWNKTIQIIKTYSNSQKWLGKKLCWPYMHSVWQLKTMCIWQLKSYYNSFYLLDFSQLGLWKVVWVPARSNIYDVSMSMLF